ncbi:MAG TPA: hypothetical protein VMW81_01260 [Nitrospinota bacterium]|nr:hypothetical protein [Nitrospinota bacterium]
MHQPLKDFYSIKLGKFALLMVIFLMVFITPRAVFSFADYLSQKEVKLDQIKSLSFYKRKFNVVKIVNRDPDREEKSKLDEVFLFFLGNYSVETSGEYSRDRIVGRRSLKQIVDQYFMDTQGFVDPKEPTIKVISKRNKEIGYIFQGSRVDEVDI